jgi:3-vinyl bacteriochlorophyllide hydratase
VWWQGQWSSADQLWLALAAYGTYAINAAQYIRKLRMARLQKTPEVTMASNAQVIS